ncbi:flagellar protein [candidate division KSB1 bacterium]|nr:MAG: flagellar protein [candidate division KSB1 bacterium]
MVNNINGQFQKLSQIEQAQKIKQNIEKQRKAPSLPSFDEVLREKVAEVREEIKFSSHAEKRLQSRNIQLTQDHFRRLQEAVAKAREKGAKETLMIFENFSLIVSVKNNVVITALDNEGMKENVFTNIDSAVFA